MGNKRRIPEQPLGTARVINEHLGGFSGSAKLYRLNPPFEKHRYVVASATVALFSGPETYLFGSDARGKIKDWGELPGSYRGGLSEDTAIRNAGYEVIRHA